MAQTGPRDKATIESLKERMARDPLSRAFLQLAEEYRKAGRFEEAVQVCNEGLARHPGYHTARIALGRTYLDAGDLESAHQALTEVLDTMPENHLAGKLLAEVQLRLGNRAGAAETYRAILSHYPGDREVEGLLNELEDGESAGIASPEPLVAPEAAGGEVPELTTATAPESVAIEPPPLEVVDGGEPPEATPSVGEAAATVTTPMDEAGTEARLAADDGTAGESAPMWESAPASTDPVDVPAEPAPAGADALQTNTLAELYLRQGLVEKALEVYRAMLRVDPANERARQRLEDLSGEGAAEDGIESAPAEAPRPEPMPTERSATEESTIYVADVEIENRDSPEPTAGAGDEPSGPSAPPVEASVDESTSLLSPESLDSPQPMIPPEPAAASEPAVAPEPTVVPEPMTAGATATIERLERWLLTIQSGSTPAGEESRR